MFPPVNDHADVGANLMVGDGLDCACGAQVNPT